VRVERLASDVLSPVMVANVNRIEHISSVMNVKYSSRIPADLALDGGAGDSDDSSSLCFSRFASLRHGRAMSVAKMDIRKHDLGVIRRCGVSRGPSSIAIEPATALNTSGEATRRRASVQ